MISAAGRILPERTVTAFFEKKMFHHAVVLFGRDRMTYLQVAFNPNPQLPRLLKGFPNIKPFFLGDGDYERVAQVRFTPRIWELT